MLPGKIFNDPVYGFVSVPYGLLLDLVDHPYLQRLRRIRQMGLSAYVYPGALHTRLHHAIGALHLTQQAVDVLRMKGADITAEEAEAVCAAILLHDIGHGPFSHALEHTLVDMHHEHISALFIAALDRQFGGRLQMALDIFEDRYPKPFLRQLVSGQLDMDRMDYLSRDSFFSGVSEGVISHERIIKMLAVHDGRLAVEEKGIYSVEKFLMARRLMYWQVYLHKTGLAAEQMLTHVLRRARELALLGVKLEAPRHLARFLYRSPDEPMDADELLQHFSLLDDTDVTAAIKYWSEAEDFTLRYLSQGLLNRRIFRLEWHSQPVTADYVERIEQRVRSAFGSVPTHHFVYVGEESNRAYDDSKDEIRILFKNGSALPITQCSDVPLYTQRVTKQYICYPKPLFSP